MTPPAITLTTQDDLLTMALKAQSAEGSDGKLLINLGRHPYESRFAKKMRLVSKNHGPYGRIVSINENGTLVEFEAIKIIAYFQRQKRESVHRKTLRPSQHRVQVHPYISESLASRAAEIAIEENVSLGAIFERALQNFLCAEPCSA